MRRLQIAPREGWRRRVEEQGLLFHSLETDQGTYWAEGTCYQLAPAEVDAIEMATNAIHAMSLQAAELAIAQRRYAELGLADAAIPLIEQSWEEEHPSIYGRLDLALGEDGVPRLLEYNADTPTSLLEGSVIQWTWARDCLPGLDQFNSIHERLVEGWRSLRPRLTGPVLHCGNVESVEDEMTVGYLRDTAEQAGLETVGIAMQDIGWDARAQCFVDLERRPIRSLFKLYPWEGLVSDVFGRLIPRAPQVRWIEPAWKALLSSKGLLALLWELFPGHPNLLPAFFDRDHAELRAGWVRKPLLGREGSNVTIEAGEAHGVRAATDGPYGAEGFVYQRYTALGEYDGFRPVLGSWLIAGEAAGVGIRETTGYVTDNRARFVPHAIQA